MGLRALAPKVPLGNGVARKGFLKPLVHCAGHLSDSGPWDRARAQTGLSEFPAGGGGVRDCGKGRGQLSRKGRGFGARRNRVQILTLFLSCCVTSGKLVGPFVCCLSHL